MLFAKLEWNVDQWLKEASDEDYKTFRDTWPFASQYLDEVRTEKSVFHTYYFRDQRITLDEAHIIEKLGVGHTLCGVDGTMLTRMKDRGAPIYSDDVRASHIAGAQVVQVTIPDLALLSITEVINVDDCCTVALQQYLEEGWRILAVCPPNAQRRPDYILGRSKGK